MFLFNNYRRSVVQIPTQKGLLFSKSKCPIGDFNFHACAGEMIKTAPTGRPDLTAFPSLRETDGNSSQVQKCNQGSVWKCHFLCITSKSPLKCILSPAIHRASWKEERSPPQKKESFDLVILFFSCCVVFFLQILVEIITQLA